MRRESLGSNAINSCDLEPIHSPGTIQPHGVMLVASGSELSVVGMAGDVERLLGPCREGQHLADILGLNPADWLGDIRCGGAKFIGQIDGVSSLLNAVAYRSGDYVIVELDPAQRTSTPVEHLAALETAQGELDKVDHVDERFRTAAAMFSKLTGYRRVMIYKFLEDGSGVVVGEQVANRSASFMNHHFPASDIPRQARQLYLRNKVRVIPDVECRPQPIRSNLNLSNLDLSDSTLRSVSPVHIKYLRNMSVAASASFSIIRNGALWGLVACHNDEPRAISLENRLAGQLLAAALSKHIKAHEEAELYQEQLILHSREDSLLAKFGNEHSLGFFFANAAPELTQLLSADGFAVVQGEDVFTCGLSPDHEQVLQIAGYARQHASAGVFFTSRLSENFPAALSFRDRASGVVTASPVSGNQAATLMWFRAEHVEVLKWAGKPHKNIPPEPGAVLTPRSSFEAWTEEVRGLARPWSKAEVLSASRIVRAVWRHAEFLAIKKTAAE